MIKYCCDVRCKTNSETCRCIFCLQISSMAKRSTILDFFNTDSNVSTLGTERERVEVRNALEAPPINRGKYKAWTAKDRAEIGKYLNSLNFHSTSNFAHLFFAHSIFAHIYFSRTPSCIGRKLQLKRTPKVPVTCRKSETGMH